jgi:hypothetical protein
MRARQRQLSTRSAHDALVRLPNIGFLSGCYDRLNDGPAESGHNENED